MAVTDLHLAQALERAKAFYESLTPEEKWLHRREQLISWAYGQIKMHNEEVRLESVEAVVDRMLNGGELSVDGTKPVFKSVWERLLENDDLENDK